MSYTETIAALRAENAALKTKYDEAMEVEQTVFGALLRRIVELDNALLASKEREKTWAAQARVCILQDTLDSSIEQEALLDEQAKLAVEEAKLREDIEAKRAIILAMRAANKHKI